MVTLDPKSRWWGQLHNSANLLKIVEGHTQNENFYGL